MNTFDWKNLIDPLFYIHFDINGIKLGIYIVLFIVFAETGLFAGFFLPGDSLLFLTGIQIVSRAIEAPLRTIVENAGLEGSVVVAKVAEGTGDFGYNAKTNEYVDMLKAGIIDPKKVTRVALENAASVSGMILTTECALIDIKEENAGGGMPMGGGMPGMM